MGSKRWSPEEIEQARENMVPPGRTRRGMNRVRRKLGLTVLRKPQAPSKRTWTQEEIRAALENRVPPGRSHRSTDRIRKALGAVPKRKRRKPWSRNRIRLLKKYHRQGIGARRMAAEGLIPLSANAIQKMMARIGLSERRKIVKFPPLQRERLRRFLKDNHEGRTPEELAEMWREANPTLPAAGHRRVVAYLAQMGLKIPYWEVSRIKKSRLREARIKDALQARKATVKELDDNVRMSRAETMRRRLERGVDIWSGKGLPEGFLEAEEMSA